MKKNLLTMLILFIGLNSFSQDDSNATEPFLAFNEKGINVYYEVEVDRAENQLLNIRFVNTTENDQTISWILLTPGKMIYNSTEPFVLPGNSDYLQKYVLEFKKDGPFDDYNFNLILEHK